jgi:hypothetical protein
MDDIDTTIIFECLQLACASSFCYSQASQESGGGLKKSEIIISSSTPRACVYASNESPVASEGSLSNRKKRGILRMNTESSALFGLCVMRAHPPQWRIVFCHFILISSEKSLRDKE